MPLTATVERMAVRSPAPAMGTLTRRSSPLPYRPFLSNQRYRTHVKRTSGLSRARGRLIAASNAKTVQAVCMGEGLFGAASNCEESKTASCCRPSCPLFGCCFPVSKILQVPREGYNQCVGVYGLTICDGAPVK